MLRSGLATLFALVLVLWTMPARTVLAPIARAAELPAAVPSVYLHLPHDIPGARPVQVLLALHGLGGNGEQFAAPLVADAERNGWLLVAPTIDYGDWTDPAQVAREDPRLILWLSDFVDHLSQYSGVAVKPRVLLLGHSRGAQLAHRFALFEPQKVLAVAAVAAGTYTLPNEQTSAGTMIRFPFGIGDMQTIAGHAFARARLIEDTEFWLGVGSEDNNPADLPRDWDQYLGTTRIQRAQVFQDALHALGARSVLVSFRGERHSLTPAMTAGAFSFLRVVDLGQSNPTDPSTAHHITRVRAHF